AEDEAVLRARLGLDKPLLEQYLSYLGNIARGDMGHSIHYGLPTSELLSRTVPATLELTFLAMFLMILISIPIGVFAATRRDTAGDHVSMLGSMLLFSTPNFWLGIMAILFFGGVLGWLPAFGRVSPDFTLPNITGFVTLDALLAGDLPLFADAMQHLIMPAVILASTGAAVNTRLTRASMLEVLRQDYIKALIAKGVPMRNVLFKHAVRNALIPVVTFVTIQFGQMLSGVVIIETVFSWPGLGGLVVTAVGGRDYQVVQSLVLIFAVLRLSVNFLTDIAYSFIDPRIRYE
ncbi:MAG: ABC transporter permease, partial [Nitrososphaerales archaeon]